MRKIVSFAVKTFCVFAVMFSLSTTACFGANDGGNGSGGSGNNGGNDESKNKGNTIPPIIILPPR